MKFDTLVESFLKEIYTEMVNPTLNGAPAQKTKLNPTEEEAVDAAVDKAGTTDPTNPPTGEESRLAQLAARRKQQLAQAGRTAAQKLQTTVTQPTT